MPRILLLLACSALLLGLVTACGDDDDDDGEETTSASATATKDASPSATTSDDKETPTDEPSVTPAPQGGDITPTAPPVNPNGTRAVEPPDANAFIAQFQGQQIDYRSCAYNPMTALVNCPGSGVFAIDPPITGQDISCELWVVVGGAVAISCQSAEPLQTRYYDIQ
jgi:hypothetical protein